MQDSGVKVLRYRVDYLHINARYLLVGCTDGRTRWTLEVFEMTEKPKAPSWYGLGRPAYSRIPIFARQQIASISGTTLFHPVSGRTAGF